MHTISDDTDCQAAADISRPSVPTLCIGMIRSCYALVGLWYARARERRSLSRLDARLMRDIGVSADEAAREAAKPFWRA